MRSGESERRILTEKNDNQLKFFKTDFGKPKKELRKLKLLKKN